MKFIGRRPITVLFVLLSLAFLLLTGCTTEDNSGFSQFEKQDDQRIIRINIRDYGAVTFRLFKNIQNDVVDEFLDRCVNGYYNGSTFYNVIDDYLLLGGWDLAEDEKKVKAKNSDELYPYRGALCANLLSDGTCSLNSFFVITIKKEQLENIKELVEHKGFTFSDYIRFGYKTELSAGELDSFMEYGGAPWLSGHTVVFGQAISGLEVLDALADIRMEDTETEFIIDSIETD